MMRINPKNMATKIHYILLACLINVELIYSSILAEDFSGNLRTPLFLMFILSGVFLFRSYKLSNMKINYLIMIAILFLFYTYINYQYLSSAPNYGFYKLQGIVFGIFLGFIVPILFNYSIKDIYELLKTILIVDVILSVLMIIVNGFPELNTGTRFSFGELNTIWLARFYGEIIILSFVYFNRNKVIKYSFLIFLLFGMILSGSKGPIISLILASVIVLLTSNYQLTAKKVIKYISLMLSTIVISFFLFKTIIARYSLSDYLLYRFSFTASEEVYGHEGRLSRIVDGLTYFTEKPIFGNGLGSFAMLRNGIDERYYPHNIYVESLTELGFIGFILLVSMTLATIFAAFKIRSIDSKINFTSRLTLLLLLFYVFNSMVSGDLGTSNYGLLIYMGILNHILVLNNENTLTSRRLQ